MNVRMTDTADKFLEAQYFFKRLVDNQNNREEFKFNLSAFLSAFRSVTLFMQKEFGKINEFKKWYSDQQCKMKANSDFSLLNTKRVMTIHTSSVKPHARITISLSDSVTATDSCSAQIVHQGGSTENTDLAEPQPPKHTIEPEVADRWLWYFADQPNKDVITICKESMEILEDIVKECELKYRPH
jgi:hypothetical protein